MTFLEAISFRPLPVTLLAVATYISLLTGLLWVHLVPPKVAPQFELNRWGVNLTDAWQDLRQITGEFRPYNAHSNDDVRDFLLKRITDIVKENQINGYDGEIEIVDDNSSNVLFEGGNANGLTVYFEGTNIMVLVRGTDATLSPVLVNAHYDSVSTGYGATDDGMAVVTVLQLVKAFTNPSRAGEHRIQRGILALLNNGEEDFLVCFHCRLSRPSLIVHRTKADLIERSPRICSPPNGQARTLLSQPRRRRRRRTSHIIPIHRRRSYQMVQSLQATIWYRRQW